MGSLYILRRGLCSRGWKFLGPGRVWGEDLILNYPQLIETTPTVALTYVEVAATSTASTLITFPATATTLTTFPAIATLSSTALAASVHRRLRYLCRHLSFTPASLQVLRLDRADMMAVASMHPVVEDRIKRAAVRRCPLHARAPPPTPPWPRDVLSIFAPAHALCAHHCPWQLRLALARFLLRSLRKSKKSKEERRKSKQMDFWRFKQMAQEISTAASRSQGGGLNAEVMRDLVREELRRGVADELKRAMPELAKMVVAEQRRVHTERPSTPGSGGSFFRRARDGSRSREGLLADLKDLWA